VFRNIIHSFFRVKQEFYTYTKIIHLLVTNEHQRQDIKKLYCMPLGKHVRLVSVQKPQASRVCQCRRMEISV
jgi:hypothetical protein